MATTTSITTTYQGEIAREYIATALLEANSLSKGIIQIKPNIKKRQIVRDFALGTDLIKAGTCDFTATGSVTTTERYLDPIELQVNLEFCKQDFRDDWDAISMGYSAHDNIPANLQAYLAGRVAASVAESNEKMLYQGAGANVDEYAGLLELFVADADVIDVATPVSIDSTNVVQELGRLVDLIPQEIYGKEDGQIVVSNDIYRAYLRSLGGFGANGQGGAGYMNQGNNQSLGSLVFDGVTITVANGLPANTMFFARKGNLWFGTGLFSDYNEFKIIDMADIDGSQNVRMVMRFTGAVQYGIGSEIIAYNADGAV